jgi:Uma2 family endonuclease
MAEPARPIFRSVDDFLIWESEQEERYEFVEGVIRMMAGGSANHDLISMNASRALGNRLVESPCRVHGSNLKVRSPAGAIMYPDAFVRCGPHRGADQVVDDAVVVVEVLSPRTEQRDLTRKRWAYQAMPSMQAILFVETERPLVELVTREPDGSWRSRVIEGLAAVVPLVALDIELALAELYVNAEFETAA